MADGQGTGKHPHKSAAEPYEHHEAATTKGEHKTTEHASTTHKTESHKAEPAKAESHTNGQGTGKHPHKSAEDPKEHHEGAKK